MYVTDYFTRKYKTIGMSMTHTLLEDLRDGSRVKIANEQFINMGFYRA